jgi:hypothetical protein
MANNVACTYSFIEAGGTVVGKRKTTEYSAYAYGTAEYGQRDYMVSVDGMSDASGTLVRNLYLQQHQVPPGVAEIGGQLSVICRGWWDTMDWRMASNTGTAGTAITSKLRGLVTSYGQFLAGAILETTNSGTLTSYFSGDNTAREEADKLMEMGGANGRQINVMVDENRLAIFSEEPAQPTGGTAAYSLDARGRLYDASGGRVLPHMAWRAVGQYVQLKDVVGATTDTTLLQDPSIQYLEGISWRAGGEIMPEFRGEVNARDIVRAKA